MKKTGHPEVTVGGEGKRRDRKGARVVAFTAPSMVRALNDAALELTSENEAFPIDDDHGLAQPPVDAVTGRRELAIRAHRARTAT
ncbi:MAG: hypothetical protein EP329_19660, partial [Deltaproteobacteria bacterium]